MGLTTLSSDGKQLYLIWLF